MVQKRAVHHLSMPGRQSTLRTLSKNEKPVHEGHKGRITKDTKEESQRKNHKGRITKEESQRTRRK